MTYALGIAAVVVVVTVASLIGLRPDGRVNNRKGAAHE